MPTAQEQQRAPRAAGHANSARITQAEHDDRHWRWPATTSPAAARGDRPTTAANGMLGAKNTRRSSATSETAGARNRAGRSPTQSEHGHQIEQHERGHGRMCRTGASADAASAPAAWGCARAPDSRRPLKRRCFPETQAHLQAHEHQHRAGQKRNAPTPGEELGIAYRCPSTRKMPVEQRNPSGAPSCGNMPYHACLPGGAFSWRAAPRRPTLRPAPAPDQNGTPRAARRPHADARVSR